MDGSLRQKQTTKIRQSRLTLKRLKQVKNKGFIMNSGQTRPPAGEGNVWKTWTCFCLEVGGLPSNTSIRDLQQWFSVEGDPTQLEIVGREAGTNLIKAKVRFDNPPIRDYYVDRKYGIKHRGQRWEIPIDKFYGWNDSKTRQGQEYPQHISIPYHSITFGVSLGGGRLKEMKTFAAYEGYKFSLELKVFTDNKNFTARFWIPRQDRSGRTLREFKFFVPVTQMKTVYHQDHSDGTCSLILPLSLPPEYYWRNTSEEATMPLGLKSWRVQDSWYRATDLLADFDAAQYHPIAVYNNISDPVFTPIGRCTTFRFRLDAQSDSLKHLRLALQDSNVSFVNSTHFSFEVGSKAAVWDLLDHTAESSYSALALLASSAQVIHLEFPVRYQLEVCITKGHINEHLITKKFLEQLAALNPDIGRLRLEYLTDQDIVLDDPMDLFSRAGEAYYQPNRLPHYCTLVRKAIVTPTSVRFSTPVAETSNRVVRKYNLLQDRFLRVQFLDEAERGKPGFKNSNEAIYTRMLRTMYQGIKIGDRTYEFLAFGSSQLREAGAYFFCPTPGTSCEDIRQWMGHFNHIRNVAKYAARLGQCFSTTREIRGMPLPQTRQVPDIEKNDYCFSDGVGIISRFLARLIVEEMALDVFDEPSAFQIRMGGCKGVLSVWPQAKGMEVHIRPSQEKFKAQFQALEVIRCSSLATASLNRQTISILECLGVRPAVFHRLLDKQLQRFQDSVTDTTEAVRLLTQFVDENQTTLIIAELLKANFLGDSTKELFVDSVLGLWRAWSLKLIKEKSRIHIEQSAFVLGVVDETGTLRGHSKETEGSKDKDPNKLPQIFLQLSDPKVLNKTTIVTGICIVGRNPSLHPGDIRVVQAVDDPILRHLKDVVIFPSTGDRPVPNMLSGGDLDGDDFFVIWDENLIPWEWNHPPMNYSGPKPKEVDGGVTVDHLRDFFVSYQKNDVLGLVASSHLGFADYKPKGPKDETCLSLAAQHSDAVDFPKTGVPVQWTSSKQKWPHFMEKKNSYRSFKTLGQLYDKVCQHSAKMEFHPDWEDDFDPRVLKRFDTPKEVLEAAENIKAQYDLAVRRILSQYSLGTEFELWTGFAMSKPAAGSDYKRSEDLRREYDVLKLRFRDMCYAAAGGQTPAKIDPFVAAMYQVTEAQVKTALRENDERTETADENGEGVKGSRRLDSTTMPLISFPWIFSWVMIRLAMGKNYSSKKTMLAPARRNLDRPVFDPMSKKHDVNSETIHAEVKPSEALNIASQEPAEPSPADDAAVVNPCPEPRGNHYQESGHTSNAASHDKDLNGNAALDLGGLQVWESPVGLNGSVTRDSNGVLPSDPRIIASDSHENEATTGQKRPLSCDLIQVENDQSAGHCEVEASKTQGVLSPAEAGAERGSGSGNSSDSTFLAAESMEDMLLALDSWDEE